LRKVYGHKITGDLNVAVKDVSFIVKHRECFALLGVNGAGKTSTFKILTGEIAPSGGNVHINGMSIMTDIPEIRNCIGYCPQFDSISELLTGKEHLELYARIKGIPKHLIPELVAQKITEMDLTKFKNIKAGNYSGGKLCFWMSQVQDWTQMLVGRCGRLSVRLSSRKRV
jgi:ATP-binding cassette subfamily A (ABC1) protein 3